MANKLKVENMSEFDMAQELRSEADIIEYLQREFLYLFNIIKG